MKIKNFNLVLAVALLAMCRFSAEGAQRVSALPDLGAAQSTDVIGVIRSGVGYKKKIGDLIPPPAASGLANDVYISNREVSNGGDGLGGDGSLRSPFNGGTQAKLDTLIKSYFDATATNITFHLGPGAFSSKGAWSGGWNMRAGWHFKGAGKTQTTITQVAGLQANTKPVFNSYNENYINQSVEELTIDCAYNRSHADYNSTTRFEAITLTGADSYVRNVKVINHGCDGVEAFAILIFDASGAGTPIDNALVEGCEVSSCGLYATGIGELNGGGTLAKNGKIINNLIDGATLVATGPPAGFSSSLLQGNTIVNSGTGVPGIFNDTGSLDNVIIDSNVADSGLMFSTAGKAMTHIKITNNIFSLKDNNNIAIGILDLNATGGSASDVVIEGNKVYRVGSPSPVYSVYLRGGGAHGPISNVRIANNTFDAASILTNDGATAVTRPGSNQTPAGAAYDIQALSGHGALEAVDLSVPVTTFVNNGTANTTSTLAAGGNGQIKTLNCISVSGFTVVITVTNLLGGTTVTLDTAGDTITLQYLGSHWVPIANVGAAVSG